MSLAFYRPVGGFFERAHPVAKLIALVVAFVPPFFGQTPLEVLPYLLFLFFAALGAGAWPNLIRVKTLALALFVMSAALWSVFYPGQTVLYSLGPISIYRESIVFGAAMGLRINCFMFAAIIFFTATRIEDFTYGLSRLGFPYVMSFALSLAFRLTPLFIQTGQEIVVAQKARGLDLDSGGLIQRIRQYVPIIVPVFSQRAQALGSTVDGIGI